MDGGFDLSSVLSSAGNSDAISKAMGILMKKPELIEMVANELGLSSDGEKSDPEPDKPPEGERQQKVKTEQENKKTNDRERLLRALRPYLSEKRRGAIDIMISLGSIGDLIGNIDPSILKTLMGGKNV